MTAIQFTGHGKFPYKPDDFHAKNQSRARNIAEGYWLDANEKERDSAEFLEKMIHRAEVKADKPSFWRSLLKSFQFHNRGAQPS